MLANHWLLVLFEGIIFLVLGIFAISQPFLMTLSVEFFIGIVLVAAGITQCIRGISSRRNSSLWTLIGGALALIAGLLLLFNPASGALTLTFLITVFLILDGITKMISAFQYRPVEGWGWVLFSGVVSLILAGLIYRGWPTTAAWVIGLYVGVYLLFLGSSLIVLSFYLKRSLPRY